MGSAGGTASEGGVGVRGSASVPPSGDLHAHELALAQLSAASDAAARLDATYARLERRLDRIASTLATIDGQVSVPVAPGQLRLVVGE